MNQFSTSSGAHSVKSSGQTAGTGDYIDVRYSNMNGNKDEVVTTAMNTYSKSNSQILVNELYKFGYSSVDGNRRGTKMPSILTFGSGLNKTHPLKTIIIIFIFRIMSQFIKKTVFYIFLFVINVADAQINIFYSIVDSLNKPIELVDEGVPNAGQYPLPTRIKVIRRVEVPSFLYGEKASNNNVSLKSKSYLISSKSYDCRNLIDPIVSPFIFNKTLSLTIDSFIISSQNAIDYHPYINTVSVDISKLKAHYYSKNLVINQLKIDTEILWGKQKLKSYYTYRFCTKEITNLEE